MNLSQAQFWTIDSLPEGPGPVRSVEIEYSLLHGITDPGALRLMRRESGSAPWEVVPSTLNEEEQVLIGQATSASGHWTLGSVSEANPLTPQLPGPPSDPSPADGAFGVDPEAGLSWQAGADTEFYDLFLWQQGEPEPDEPRGKDLDQSSFSSRFFVQLDEDYHWRVVAKNIDGNTAGPVWSFSSDPLPDLALVELEAPSLVQGGQSIEVAWVVENTAATATLSPFWSDWIVMSEDTVFDRGDRILKRVGNISALAEGESYRSSALVEVPAEIDGDYQLLVVANGQGELEANRENNTASSAITVEPMPRPDLVIEQVQAPRSSFSGLREFISWKVANGGTGATLASSWEDRVYLSKDEVLDPEEDIFLGSHIQEGTLVPGGDYTASAAVQLPVAVSGSFYWLVESDVSQEVLEPAEASENVAAAPLDIVLSPPPDLAVQEVAGPGATTAGQTIDVSWTVRNNGPGEIEDAAWRDALFLSPEREWNPESAILLDTVEKRGSLALDAEYQLEIPVRIPYGVEGPHFLLAHTDNRKEIFEGAFEDNNTGTTVQPLEITAPALPDLEPVEVAAPQSVQARSEVTVGWSVRNRGDAVAEGSWQDAVYLSQSEEWDSQNALRVGTFSQTGDLAPGQEYHREETVVVPYTLKGDHFFFVVTDRDRDIIEGVGESNNHLQSAPIAIDPYPLPDLQVEQASGPSSAMSGQEIEVNWSVRNEGEGDTIASGWSDAIYLSANDRLDPGRDILLARIPRTESLDSGVRYSRRVALRLPDEVSGNFFLLFQADTGNQIEETTLTNNVAASGTLSISSAPSADLIAENIRVNGALIGGRNVEVEWDVRNAGEAAAEPDWFDAVYLSRDRTVNLLDLRLAVELRSTPLEPGESYTLATEFQWPTYFSGNVFLLVKTDSRNDLFERQGEGNNVAALEVDSQLAATSDLVVREIAVPSEAEPGQIIEVGWVLVNQGENPAQGRIREAVYLSEDGQWDVDDPLLGVKDRFINLEPEEEAPAVSLLNLAENFSANSQAEIQEALPAIFSGDYHVIVRADTTDAIRETDNANNAAISSETLRAVIPELDFNFPQSRTLSAGQTYYFRLHVADSSELLFPDIASTVRLHLETDLPATSELHVRRGVPPRRSQSDFSARSRLKQSLELNLPVSEKGDYYVLIHLDEVDGEAGQQVTITAHREDLNVDQVQPSEGGRGKPVTVKIEGAAMAPATRVFLRNGDQELQAETTHWFSPVEMWATFDLTGAEKAVYDVVLKRSRFDLHMDDSGEESEPYVDEVLFETVAQKAFTVVDPLTVPVELSVDTPNALRPDSRFGFAVRAVNRSNHDMESPLVLVYGKPGFLKKFDGETSFQYGSRLALLVPQEGPAGILTAGARATVRFRGVSPRNDPALILGAAPVGQSGLEFQLENLLARAGLSAPFPEWDEATDTLNARTRGWSEFRQLLAETASQLSLAGSWQPNAQELLESAFEEILQQQAPRDEIPAAALQQQVQDDSETRIEPFNHGGECDALALARERATLTATALAFEGYGVGGSGAGADHLNHFLHGNGTPRHYGPNSEVAAEFRDYTGANRSYEYFANLVTGPVKSQVRQSIISQGQCVPGFVGQLPDMNFSSLVQEYSAPEMYDGASLGPGAGSDLRLAFGGFNMTTKAWVSDVQYGFIECPDCDSPGQGFYRAKLHLMFRDRYSFDATDAGRHFLAAAGHNLEACGAAQPFNTSITMTETIGGTFYMRPLDDCDEPPEPPDTDLPIPPLLGPWPEINIPIPVSQDPNDIIGPAGVGDRNFISIDDTLNYRIRFENDPELATAPAQTVSIRKKLDDNLDSRSFRLGPFGFQDFEFEPEKPAAVLRERLDLVEELGLWIEVNAGLDIENNEVFWQLTSIDPETGETPVDPFQGFLPVNDDEGNGEGYVSYTIRPDPSSESGDLIKAEARIVFDINEPIDTPAISNAIDAHPPVTAMNTLGPVQSDAVFDISWSGEDETDGSGLDYTDIYVSVDQAPPQIWLEKTREASARFSGEIGRRYDFYVVGEDRTANQESFPRNPDGSTFVIGQDNYFSWLNDATSLPISSWPPEDDPDRDGRANLLEYGMGSNPEVPDWLPGPRVRSERIEGQDRVRIELVLPEQRPDVAFGLSQSDDLIQWEQVPEAELSREFVNGPDGAVILRLHLENGLEARQFFKITVEQLAD
ncbi:MAG: CARDB domain-containing protein [Opitutales bacterium]